MNIYHKDILRFYINPTDFQKNTFFLHKYNMVGCKPLLAMWATFAVNLVSPQQKQGDSGRLGI